jgi:hypothetical protein
MTTSAQGILGSVPAFRGKVRQIDIQLINDLWKPLSGVGYRPISSDGQETGGKQTDGDGYLTKEDVKPGSSIKVELSDESLEKEIEYPDNPGPLPLLELRNRSEGGNGPLQRGDKRADLVKHLQLMLYELGLDLGISGSDENGIDGDFGTITEEAVRDYQVMHKDWEGKNLKVDVMVGPRTGDALNRSMVGLWYDTYETPSELTEDFFIKTFAASMTRKGLKI